jgi:hypothetical protein
VIAAVARIFRIRDRRNPWIYVEVTQLNESTASARTQEAIQRIANQVKSILRPFVLEIVLWREPTEDEENELVGRAYDVCQENLGQASCPQVTLHRLAASSYTTALQGPQKNSVAA